ncbi:MAG: hypothetical protein M0R30_03080 [Methanoregula sp.]|jgi:hypothetical protein|uniref:hypothetical protein n=1 Tax=Methanoregula sp. TaxID=2052170 RepID=UPI0025DFF68C|nr:hypothetical protein [Methanoregula sp.]MCK9630604.1 hypothetical protein [Methanoregula sp.]
MKKNEKKSKGSASGIRILIVLAIICLCFSAMAPAVAAACNDPPTDKWLCNVTVLANKTGFGTVDGLAYNNDSFFAVLNHSHFSTTPMLYPYCWTTGYYPYTDRKYLETLNVGNGVYPAVMNPTDDYEWKFVNDSLDKESFLFKRGLAAYANHYNSTCYLWYGNVTKATSPWNGKDNWLFPTYENATYVLRLDVNWTGPA